MLTGITPCEINFKNLNLATGARQGNRMKPDQSNRPLNIAKRNSAAKDTEKFIKISKK